MKHIANENGLLRMLTCVVALCTHNVVSFALIDAFCIRTSSIHVAGSINKNGNFGSICFTCFGRMASFIGYCISS